MSEESAEIRNVKGDVVAATGGSNIVGKEITIKGDVNNYYVTLTPEQMQWMKGIKAMPTEVQPGNAAGIEGGKTALVGSGTQKGNSELMTGILEALKKQGKDANEVVAGDMHFSRVELL